MYKLGSLKLLTILKNVVTTVNEQTHQYKLANVDCDDTNSLIDTSEENVLESLRALTIKYIHASINENEIGAASFYIQEVMMLMHELVNDSEALVYDYFGLDIYVGENNSDKALCEKIRSVYCNYITDLENTFQSHAMDIGTAFDSLRDELRECISSANAFVWKIDGDTGVLHLYGRADVTKVGTLIVGYHSKLYGKVQRDVLLSVMENSKYGEGYLKNNDKYYFIVNHDFTPDHESCVYKDDVIHIYALPECITEE